MKGTVRSNCEVQSYRLDNQCRHDNMMIISDWQSPLSCLPTLPRKIMEISLLKHSTVDTFCSDTVGGLTSGPMSDGGGH